MLELKKVFYNWLQVLPEEINRGSVVGLASGG